MPPKTRLNKKEKRAALKVLTASLFDEDDASIYDILIHNDFNSADDIIQTTEDRLEALKDSAGNVITTNKFGYLRSLRNYVHYAKDQGITTDHDFYKSIDLDEFDDFRTGPMNASSTEIQASVTAAYAANKVPQSQLILYVISNVM